MFDCFIHYVNGLLAEDARCRLLVNLCLMPGLALCPELARCLVSRDRRLTSALHVLLTSPVLGPLSLAARIRPGLVLGGLWRPSRLLKRRTAHLPLAGEASVADAVVGLSPAPPAL